MKKVLLICLSLFCSSAYVASAKVLPKDPSVTVKVETIRGTLSIVDSNEKLIFVKSSEGVTYDFHVTASTSITLGDRKLKFDELAEQIGKQTAVSFRPLHAGNMAVKIEIQ